MTTRTRTRLSPEARKRQLLETAKQMILDEGLQSFSIEGLARTANVSSPLIYNYFSSRKELLQALLALEYQSYIDRLNTQVSKAQNFKEMVRAFIASNFVDHAPGKILPILESQPEIVKSIKDSRDQHGQNIAQFLVEATAESYKLTKAQARLVVYMSSGASKAAAEYASNSHLELEATIDAALSYLLAGIKDASTHSE